MDPTLLLEQALNGLQLGVTLFLLAAGLTLVFGIMDVINLAHGSFYMVGAYLTAWLARETGSFALGLAGAVALTALLGLLVERLAVSRLYARDHLDQVSAPSTSCSCSTSWSGSPSARSRSSSTRPRPSRGR